MGGISTLTPPAPSLPILGERGRTTRWWDGGLAVGQVFASPPAPLLRGGEKDELVVVEGVSAPSFE
jgi:hypothetical protein